MSTTTITRRNGDARNPYSYTIRNPFHNTHCTVHVHYLVDSLDELYDSLCASAYLCRSRAAARRIQRIDRTLCGLSDCHCANMWTLA